jgi:hypothetical protein
MLAEKTVEEIYPLLESIAVKMYNPFKEIYKDLAMDVDDVIQENYMYYLDFKNRFISKFKENVLFSAIKQYVIWKNLELINNWMTKKAIIISLDTEMGTESEQTEREKESRVHETLVKAKGINFQKIDYLNNKLELNKLMLKLNPEFNKITFLSILGERKFNILVDVLESGDSLDVIGKRYNASRQYVSRVYSESVNQIRERFYK